MTQPQLPSRTILTCPVDAGHKIRTRQTPGSVLICTACGQAGRHGVTVTVSAPLPAVRPPLPASPEGLAVISRRKTAPERWYCSSCRGSAATPAPGEPVPGWQELRAAGDLLARACTEECLARCLPEVQQRLAGRPWVAPEPPPGGNIRRLMAEVPKGQGRERESQERSVGGPMAASLVVPGPRIWPARDRPDAEALPADDPALRLEGQAAVQHAVRHRPAVPG